ncbi:MAG: hypothetical protein JWM80_1799 [Cyanobacteria bacterium RYN_339]|nr:hypothetical protein [Cyanobacteria bacterium RYN_339]
MGSTSCPEPLRQLAYPARVEWVEPAKNETEQELRPAVILRCLLRA